MPADAFTLDVELVDIARRAVVPRRVSVADGRIKDVTATGATPTTFLLPGFVDAHVHIESSMLVPSEFARAAVVHGTVATVSDPHEIANVLGMSGVRYMLENAATVPFKFCFGAPSCVPATSFETSGAEITVDDVGELLDDARIGYLSEMMNYPGVLQGDETCLAKIRAAHERGKPIDGHAPGLRGTDAHRYFAAGITTDHECFAKDEALEKIALGAKIAIREGSAARNFDALYTLLAEHPEAAMLCSDDKHPDELLTGHINALVRRAVQEGIDLFDVLRAACVNPVDHYQLNVGQLHVGDPADFIEVDGLDSLRVLRTWIDGQLVAERGNSLVDCPRPSVVNNFAARRVEAAEIALVGGPGEVNVMEAIDGQLVTNRLRLPSWAAAGPIASDSERDVLKLVVVNRYQTAAPAVALVKNFGFRRGAIASSVAHDSHNVIAVGVADEDIVAAINAVMEAAGGLSVVSAQDDLYDVLALPVAGLMATQTCSEVGRAYARLDSCAKQLGTKLRSPYMTLSFMALLVIPELKLSDRGLFDGRAFRFLPVIDAGTS